MLGEGHGFGEETGLGKRDALESGGVCRGRWVGRELGWGDMGLEEDGFGEGNGLGREVGWEGRWVRE